MYNACMNTKKITPEIFEKQYLEHFEPVEPKYIVYRLGNMIYFVDERANNQVRQFIGIETSARILYLSTYVINLNTYKMVKNRYPDQPWPKQIMEEIFSGVGNEIELR